MTACSPCPCLPNPPPPYGWYGAYVTFFPDAPDYKGPADQGGIWGYWWFNADPHGQRIRAAPCAAAVRYAFNIRGPNLPPAGVTITTVETS